MNGMWGNILGVSIFGQSHGKAIGVVINNIPVGIKLDLGNIQYELNRRSPSNDIASTTRKEDDRFEIYSGYFDEHTTGTPLMALILNKDVKSDDYSQMKSILRPSHADWSAYQKFGKFNDYRGGGYFSGRLTAGIVFAGAIAKQILKIKDIDVQTKILSIGNLKYDFDNANKTQNELEKGKMIQQIYRIKDEKDSVGGKIKVIVSGVDGGLGGTLFESVEGRISHIIFAVPAVKGIEFGRGFEFAKLKGSECNDELFIKDGQISAMSNNNGGILGGITNGMPIEFNVAIKPTPSIGKTQKTVNVSKNEDVKFDIKGRHDACIVPRVMPVLEAATALVILDMLLEERGRKWM